ncbi:hypothetical protein B6U99_04540 [Candidatus Geothermarchaeota archaeon ex4572_27]|nr:MAG: hypothetical protein B6U99_04540 [Candidatus Geothermarchaeota archaeon ex4572_27]
MAAIGAACLIGFFLTVSVFEERGRDILREPEESEKLVAFRALARALLEEMDEAVATLREIRDILREVR